MHTLLPNDISDDSIVITTRADLCLSCRKNDIEEWDDEQACNCKAEKGVAGDFFCFAYDPLW